MSTSLSSQLNYIQTQLVFYYLPPVYVLGIVGNLIIIWTFSRRALRSNGCSLYFVCMSLIHFVLLNVVCLTRITGLIAQYDPFGSTTVLCKFRSYVNILCIVLSRNFLCLISIDRWLISSSNAWLRKQSSPRVARWVAIGSSLFWTLFSIHALIGYEVFSGSCRPAFASIYGLFYSIYAIVVSMICPIIIIIFSIMTIINVRKSARRTHVTSATNNAPLTEQQRKRKKRDMQLIFVSLIQTILYLFFNFIISIWPLYVYLLSFQGTLSANQSVINLFINYLSTYLMYTYTAVRISIYLSFSCFK